MLVLSRKMNETVVIDGQIEFEVLKVKGNRVTLGITAPSTVKILRGEVSPFEIEKKTSEIVLESVETCVVEQGISLPNPTVISHCR